MNQTQLIFDFSTQQNPARFQEEDFVFAAENQNAVDSLKKFFSQKSFTTNAIPSFILKGEHACGKTHLLHIFARKFHAIFLQKDELSDINLPLFFTENNFYIIENIDEIKNEETLLHAINSASEAKAFLILSAANVEHFTLRDLVSRIKNIFTVEIKNPTPDLIKILLAQDLSRRQLKIGDDVIEFLANRLKPSYGVVGDVLKIIEFHCHENKKNFTLAEAKKII